MKKILLFLFLGAVSFTAYSCDNDDDVVVQNPVDYDTFPRMVDATGSFNVGNSYSLIKDISIAQTDVVLVYRRDGNAWQQIPKTMYLDTATLPTARKFEYNFVFDAKEVEVRIDNQNFNLSTLSSAEVSQYLTNQTFRIVLVPADPAPNSKAKASTVDYSDYNAVVKYYNLDETKVKTIKFN